MVNNPHLFMRLLKKKHKETRPNLWERMTNYHIGSPVWAYVVAPMMGLIFLLLVI